VKIQLAKLFKKLGPGVITGAADDDPSGIAAYSQAGAMFGPMFLWANLYVLPLVFAVQEVAGRIGLVTGKGIAKNLKENYSKPLLLVIVSLLIIANTINLGADLGAIATAIQLLVPVNLNAILIVVTVGIILLEVFTSYRKYANVLKWLTLSLFAYIITGFFVQANWGDIFVSTIVPHLKFNFASFFTLIGIVGTTISPYVMFWQANEEVEEEMDAHTLKRSGGIPKITEKIVKKMRLDTFIGMLFAAVSAWFIMLTAATTLFPHGINNIETAVQAATALEPLVQAFPYSGFLAKVLFALGIIGTGLLAVPILAASSSYAISEVLGWKEGLNNKLKRAKPFYLLILISTVIGLLINYVGINPIQALVYAAVLNGVISIPLIAMILAMANNRKVMGEHVTPRYINFLGYVALAVVIAGVVGGVVTYFIK